MIYFICFEATAAFCFQSSVAANFCGLLGFFHLFFIYTEQCSFGLPRRSTVQLTWYDSLWYFFQGRKLATSSLPVILCLSFIFHLSPSKAATKPQFTQWQVKEGCSISFCSEMELHACLTEIIKSSTVAVLWESSSFVMTTGYSGTYRVSRLEQSCEQKIYTHSLFESKSYHLCTDCYIYRITYLGYGSTWRKLGIGQNMIPWF